MGGGLAFIGEVGGHDHLPHHAVGGALDQAIEPEFLWTDAVQGAQTAHQHVVEAHVGMRLLHHVEVDRHLDDTEQRRIALAGCAAIADLRLGKGIAALAMDDALQGL